MKRVLQRVKSGKAVVPDDIPMEEMSQRGGSGVFFSQTFNKISESERMSEEWTRSVLVSIFKNKGNEFWQLQRTKVDEPHNEVM